MQGEGWNVQIPCRLLLTLQKLELYLPGTDQIIIFQHCPFIDTEAVEQQFAAIISGDEGVTHGVAGDICKTLGSQQAF